MENRDFVTLKEPEDIQIVRLKVRDLGLGGTATSDQIYERGRALGFELCSAEVGPHLRLKDTDQPLGSVYWIAMKQIVGRYGYPSVFGWVAVRMVCGCAGVGRSRRAGGIPGMS